MVKMETEIEIEEELKGEFILTCPCCKRKLLINIKAENFIDSILVNTDDEGGVYKEVDFVKV